MSLIDEVKQGKLNIDASNASTAAEVSNTFISLGDVMWPCVYQVVSINEAKVGISFPIKDEGGVPMADMPEGQTFPDLKKLMAAGDPLEVVIIRKEPDGSGKELDRVNLVLEIQKLRDVCEEGQIWVRHLTLGVLGHREELDFEPPVVTMPSNPFSHAGDKPEEKK